MFAYIPVYHHAKNGPVEINWRRGTFHVVILEQATTTLTFANPIEGMTCSVLLVQDNAGGRLVEWDANYSGHPMDPNIYPTIKWMNGGDAPELTSDANAGDMVSLKWLVWPGKYYWGMYTLGMT
jgi:hypothetical protein